MYFDTVTENGRRFSLWQVQFILIAMVDAQHLDLSSLGVIVGDLP